MPALLLIALSIALSIGRLFVDTDPALTWAMAGFAASVIVPAFVLTGESGKPPLHWVWAPLLFSVGALIGLLGLSIYLHSLPRAAFIFVAHSFIGYMLRQLWNRRGRWELGWFCLLLPSLLELGLFLLARALASIPAV